MDKEDIVVYVDPDLWDLIPGFLENRQKDVEEIKRLVVEGNLGEIQRLGHNMKGAGGGYGFDDISKIGKGIEEVAKRGDIEEIGRLNERLEGYLSVVKVVVKSKE